MDFEILGFGRQSPSFDLLPSDDRLCLMLPHKDIAPESRCAHLLSSPAGREVEGKLK